MPRFHPGGWVDPPQPEPKTIYDWNELLKHFTYKPGWHVTLTRPVEGSLYNLLLKIRFSATNAYNFNETVEVHGVYQLRPCYTEAEMLNELARNILEAERHELGEFFVHRGNRPFDPHSFTKRDMLP